MPTLKKNIQKEKSPHLESGEAKKLALHYMQTLVDVAREPFLMLDPDLRVILANPVFYETFKVTARKTEDKLLYELGNGQWDIPQLKKLLEEILPKKRIVKNYEVAHVFEKIGPKTILLNAQQIDSVQLIILAMEDITERKNLQKTLAQNVKELAAKVRERTLELTDRVKELESLNKSMVGRELKMVELKKKIEHLKNK